MKKVVIYCLFLGAFAVPVISCSSQQRTYENNVAVGGVGNVKNPTTADEMLRAQEKETERQEKELEDIKRQEYYDYKQRQYLNRK